MSLIERVEQLIAARVAMDAMTPVLRSEGFIDSDIAACYDSLVQSGRYSVVTNNRLPFFTSCG